MTDRCTDSGGIFLFDWHLKINLLLETNEIVKASCFSYNCTFYSSNDSEYFVTHKKKLNAANN